MKITHNDIVTVLGAALSLVVFMLGYWRGHYRAYAECCDCCTCQTCTEPDLESRLDWDLDDEDVRRNEPYPEAAGTAEIYNRRHAVVLEPGPTIYPALAELAGEVLDGPESHPDATVSTWVHLEMVSWESRYPIPVGAP